MSENNKQNLDNRIESFIVNFVSQLETDWLNDINAGGLPHLLATSNLYFLASSQIYKNGDVIDLLLERHLNLYTEVGFNQLLKNLAIFVSSEVYGGKKSAAEGIDLEFDKEGVRYIVAIKSGPNWGNSSQIKRMINNFKQATRILRTQNNTMNVIAVNGCCYGKDSKPNKGDYFKYCGQEFWQFLSDNENLYIDIIKPLEHRAKEKNDEFNQEYDKLLNRFTRQIFDDFCFQDGTIDWEKLIKFNSGKN